MSESKIIRTCKDCGASFEITQGEQEFYRENGLQLPLRCKACRDARRNNKKKVKGGKK